MLSEGVPAGALDQHAALDRSLPRRAVGFGPIQSIGWSCQAILLPLNNISPLFLLLSFSYPLFIHRTCQPLVKYIPYFLMFQYSVLIIMHLKPTVT